MVMNKNFYVVFGNNKDTEGLINHLSGKDDGVITVIDNDLEFSLIRKDDITYMREHLLDSIEDLAFNYVFYYYIDPANRIDRQKWKRSRSRIETE